MFARNHLLLVDLILDFGYAIYVLAIKVSLFLKLTSKAWYSNTDSEDIYTTKLLALVS